MSRLNNLKYIVATAFFVLTIIVASNNIYADSDLFVDSEVVFDEDTYLFTLDFNEGVDIKSVTSSNTNVISVGSIYSSFVYLYVQGVGTTTITATDVNGDTDTCLITIKPEELIMGETELIFSNYDVDEDEDYRYVHSDTNDLKRVTSSNTSVAKVSLYYEDVIQIVPVSAGTTVITVTDIYNQIATINVEVTQKYSDEMKYLEMLQEACAYTNLYYGDTEISFTAYSAALKNVTVQVEIGGVPYTAIYRGYTGEEYSYLVTGIPVLPIGTKTKYTLSIGEAIHTYSSKIKAGDLLDNAYMWFARDDQRSFEYTGKKIIPSLSVEYYYNHYSYSKKLKKNTDYKLTYSNNKNVGVAKVTAQGIGNYSKSISETFQILPKGTSLSKLTASKKALNVKWNKQTKKMSKSRVTGYQIRYSTKKSMSGAKKVAVKGYSKTSKKISKLKANTKYYVQIRTYMKVGKKNYYSKWSAKKSLKTK